jgi:hypothetical protein
MSAGNMNDQPNLDPLLNDLLADSAYPAFRATLKNQAHAALRRRRLCRQALAAGGAMVLLGLAMAGLWRLSGNSRPGQLTRRPPLPVVPPGVEAAKLPARIETISDDQLLASFPPGSCFLAEVDGETVLIFLDPKLREEVMR